MKNVQATELTEQQARIWLIENDPEEAVFWEQQPEGDLAESVCENLRDYGCQNQCGQYQVYFDDETLERIEWYAECQRRGHNISYWPPIL